MLLLMYGCTSLMKHYEKKLNENYTRILYIVLNKSWREYSMKQQLKSHFPLTLLTIQLRSTEHCWRYRPVSYHIQTHQCWPTNKNLHPSALCEYWVPFLGPSRSNSQKGWMLRLSQNNLCYQENFLMMMMIRLLIADSHGNNPIILMEMMLIIIARNDNNDNRKLAQKKYKSRHDLVEKKDPQGIVHDTKIWPCWKIMNSKTRICPRKWDTFSRILRMKWITKSWLKDQT